MCGSSCNLWKRRNYETKNHTYWSLSFAWILDPLYYSSEQHGKYWAERERPFCHSISFWETKALCLISHISLLQTKVQNLSHLCNLPSTNTNIWGALFIFLPPWLFASPFSPAGFFLRAWSSPPGFLSHKSIPYSECEEDIKFRV